MKAKTISISAKCSDLFSATLRMDNGETREYDGYVPRWFPNPDVEHFGDYIDLTIDVETGQILNWKKPTSVDITETFKKS